MNIQSELKRHTKHVNELIETYMPERDPDSPLICAMHYAMDAGGKRIRPILMEETYHLFGGHSGVVEPFMAAMEMIHTFSLIHDDLPAIDNDSERRGKPSTHVVYGEAQAILAGDALLNRAYETALKAFELDPLNRRIIHSLRALSCFTGVNGMIRGESNDVWMEGKDLSEEQLLAIDKDKTGALIRCSMLLGAVLAGTSTENCRTIDEMACDLGLAFQIRDDLLDGDGFAAIYGTEKADEKVRELTERALETLDRLSAQNEEYDPEFFRSLIAWLGLREH